MGNPQLHKRLGLLRGTNVTLSELRRRKTSRRASLGQKNLVPILTFISRACVQTHRAANQSLDETKLRPPIPTSKLCVLYRRVFIAGGSRRAAMQ
jgi:hypothetical protein